MYKKKYKKKKSIKNMESDPFPLLIDSIDRNGEIPFWFSDQDKKLVKKR